MKAEQNEIQMQKTTYRGGIMMKKRFSTLKNEKGLTLIELLAVIVILAIVAAIAVPAIGNIINNSKDRAVLAEASNILSGAKIAMTDGACKATADTCSKDELGPYVEGVTGTGVDFGASKSGNEWSVTYSKLGTIKNADYKPDSTTVTETKLNELLQK